MWFLLLALALAILIARAGLARRHRAAAVAVLLAALTAVTLVSNLQARGSEPVRCIVRGGSWSPWSGWTC